MRRSAFGIKSIMLAACGIAGGCVGAQPARGERGSPLAGALAGMTVDLRVAKIARPEGWLPAGLATPHTPALFDPPVIRIRDDRATLSNRAVVRSTHAEFGTSSQPLTLDITRVRRPAADAQPIAGLRRDRSSVSSLDAGYAVHLGAHDSIALTATVGAEKHKPLIAIAGSRAIGTSTRAIGVRWRRSGGLRFDAGWFGVDPLRPLTTIDRAVSLAAGSAIAERGYRAEASVPLELHDRCRAQLGIRVATASIDQEDRLALGAIAGRDRRATLSLGIRFP